MSKELIDELKLLGAGEELIIRNTGNQIIITRSMRAGDQIKSCQRSISFCEMQMAKIDLVAYGLGKLRSLIRLDILEQRRVASGWGDNDSGESP